MEVVVAVVAVDAAADVAVEEIRVRRYWVVRALLMGGEVAGSRGIAGRRGSDLWGVWSLMSFRS